MIAIIKSKFRNLAFRYAKTNTKRYINYLRKKGIKIGTRVLIRDPKTTTIDLSRPSLIEIGNNVDINSGFTILTHDYITWVFLNYFKEFIPSSGKVKIGNNIVFGQKCTILKGVTIGDNCIIGFGSTITKDIPPNCVVVGSPAKIIGTTEEYYQKRKNIQVNEAFDYARSIKERFGRMPVVEDFWEEFPLFVDAENIHEYQTLPYNKQLGSSYNEWLKVHKKQFNGFEDFLKNAGL